MSDRDRRAFLKEIAAGVAAFTLAPEALAAPLRFTGAPLEVGVIGVGRWGRQLIGELAKFEAAKVVAVVDIIEARLKGAKRRARGAEGYTSYTEMLDAHKDLKAVFIATPTHLHRQIAEDCLAAGLHVYCEAPMASTRDDLAAMLDAAKSADTRFQVGHLARSNPVYKLARSFLRSGNIGDLVALGCQYRKKTDWSASHPWRLDPKVSTGLVGEFGSHQFDTVNWFVNRFPEQVRGWSSNMLYTDQDVADTVQCVLEYSNGLRLNYDATLANSYESSFELFVGTLGTIKMAELFGWMFKEADAPTHGWEVYASRQEFHNESGITLIADATKLAKEGKDLKTGLGLPNPPLYYAIECFLKSILEDAPVVCTASDGYRAAMLSLIVNEATAKGEVVTVDAQVLKGA